MEVSINGARILATFENVPIFGTVQITQTLAVAWLVMLIISALCIWLGSNLKVTGISRKQAVAEMIYTSLVNFLAGFVSILSGTFTGKILFVTQEGYRTAYYIAAVLYLLAACLLFFGLRHYNRTAEVDS